MTTDTPQLNDHKQNCGSASAEGKPAYIMPSDSNFAEGKTEYPPMHNGEFDISRIIISCTLCNKRQILLFPYYQLS